MRRAFRWCVMLVALFTVMLWFSEHFLRYDHAERLYLAALTKYPAAGRNFLRQAVVHDRENNEYPTPKYVEALAEREEDDLVLPTYDEAYTVDPDNWSLALQYGCRLSREGQFASARLRFREAAELAPKNLLPIYLEASVVPWQDDAGEDLEPAMALIARANGTPGTVSFPRPLWSSALPQFGYWYASLRQQIVDACSEPLYKFISLVSDRAEQDISEGHIDPWPERLESLERMGWLVAQGSQSEDSEGSVLTTGGIRQVYLGLVILREVISQRKRIDEKTGSGPDEDRIRLGVRVEEYLDQIRAFDAQRQEIINAERGKYRFPIRLCAATLAVLSFCYVVVYLACKIARVTSTSHSVGHSSAGRAALLAWGGCVLGLLTVISIGQRTSTGALPGEGVFFNGWWLMVVLFSGFGILYPALTLPGVSRVLEIHDAKSGPPAPQDDARRKYRKAYLSLLRRYLGILLGAGLSVMCAWTVGYRILEAVYPWEVELLATGLNEQEAELVRHILASLG